MINSTAPPIGAAAGSGGVEGPPPLVNRQHTSNNTFTVAGANTPPLSAFTEEAVRAHDLPPSGALTQLSGSSSVQSSYSPRAEPARALHSIPGLTLYIYTNVYVCVISVIFRLKYSICDLAGQLPQCPINCSRFRPSRASIRPWRRTSLTPTASTCRPPVSGRSPRPPTPL